MLLLRNARQAHGLDYALVLRDEHGVVAFNGGMETLDREVRVDGEAGFQLLTRLVEQTQARESGGQIEIGPGIVAVGVDRLSQPATAASYSPRKAFADPT